MTPWNALHEASKYKKLSSAQSLAKYEWKRQTRVRIWSQYFNAFDCTSPHQVLFVTYTHSGLVIANLTVFKGLFSFAVLNLWASIDTMIVRHIAIAKEFRHGFQRDTFSFRQEHNCESLSIQPKSRRERLQITIKLKALKATKAR